MKHNFTRFKTIQSFGDTIQNDMMTMYMTNNEQIQFAKSGDFSAIVQGHFLKENKLIIMLLKVKHFYYPDN